MLLIFFLVTTSMDVDKGLTRQLPAKEKTEVMEPMDVPRENLIELSLTADNTLLVNGESTPIARLRPLLEKHIAQRGPDHLLSISAHPEASYDTYFQMQNEIVAAYTAVREALSKSRFHTTFSRLTEQQRDLVKAACPQRIAEQYNAPEQKGGEP